MKRVVSGLFIITGIAFIAFGGYLLHLRHSPKLITFNNFQAEKTVVPKVQAPTRIVIPSLSINLPVEKAITDGKNWEVTNNGISHLANSPLPGDRGNSVLYGHNWESLLGNLTKIKTGEVIEITLNSGEVRKFIVEYTATISPDQTYVIKDTSDTRITLYTCTGFLDSKRFVVVAKPTNT